MVKGQPSVSPLRGKAFGLGYGQREGGILHSFGNGLIQA